MATQPLPRYSVEEYLALEDSLDYPSEYHDGHILPVEAVTLTHAQLETRIGSLLDNAFPPGCTTFGPGLNLYIPSMNKILHPDATIVCGTLSCPKTDCVDNPFVLVEITSPTSKDYDYGTKRGYYFTLPSLQHYLLVSQTEALVGHYQRSGEGWLYGDRGTNSMIHMGDVWVAVAEIYAGVSSSEQAPSLDN